MVQEELRQYCELMRDFEKMDGFNKRLNRQQESEHTTLTKSLATDAIKIYERLD